MKQIAQNYKSGDLVLLDVPVPAGVRAEHAAFTTVGAIAMQDYRQLEPVAPEARESSVPMNGDESSLRAVFAPPADTNGDAAG